jgi:SAM-dependent methyltransferase
VYTYDQQFYKYINRGALDSAREVVPVLLGLLQGVDTVLDVGCGAGAWLSVWKEAGVQVTGLDGDYVDRQRLLIDAGSFEAVDLAVEFSLRRRFDLAQSLEVAEHLPESGGRALVVSLCSHADVVVFSAAAPGQGGENHINEQSYQYWQNLFAAQGYRMYDAVRPLLMNKPGVMPWYRYNTFLYVREDVLPELQARLKEQAVAVGRPPVDVSPRWYQLRKQLIRLLPVWSMTWLAKLKKHLFPLLER